MDKVKGYNNEFIKIKNRGQVFEQLVTNNGIYRRDLVEKCGLAKMTISYIINEFIEKDIIVETVRGEENKLGRKSAFLRLSPGTKKIVGLLIHRNYISAALCDCQLSVLRAKTIRFTNCTQEILLEKAFELVDEMKDGNEIFGIGIGSIGPVNSNEGIILNPPNFWGIKNVPIVQIFREHYGVPVYLDYQYNCAARAEKYFGKGKKYNNFILVSVTNSLGLAVVVNKRILTRMTGISSEFGHITIDYNGTQCFCGRRGCLGGYVDFSSEESTWRSVKLVCAALSGICDILIPQAIIVRDEDACINSKHLKWMEDELNQKIIAGGYQHIDVFESYRSKELEASGCAANILGRIFSGEIVI